MYYSNNSVNFRDFTKNVKVEHEPQMLSFINEIVSKTYVDRSWQRKFVWDIIKQASFMTNFFNGHSTTTSMTLADVKQCLEYCKRTNQTASAEYFQSVLDRGYEFICIDGQNRMITIQKFYADQITLMPGKICVNDKPYEFIDNHLPYYSTLPFELQRYADSIYIPVSTVTEASLEGMKELFRNANDGMDLNDQEFRTSFHGPVSEYILDLGKKHNRMSSRIKFSKTFGVERRGDEKLLAQMLLFQTNTSKPMVNKRGLDKMYQNTALPSNHKFHKKNLNEMSKCIINGNLHDDFSVAWAMNEYIWIDTIHSFGYKILNHTNLHEFYLNMETTLREEGKKVAEEDSYNKWSSGFGNLNKRQRTLGVHFMMFREYQIDEGYIVEVDSQRCFTKSQRYEMLLKADEVDNIDGEPIPRWGIYSKMYEADHIKPFSIGGETSVDNGQLIKKEYNRAKGAKV